MTVTVVSCVYGPAFAAFVPRWLEYVKRLDPGPDEIIVSSDVAFGLNSPQLVSDCPWRNPQAYYLQRAIMRASSDWVWIVDIDDCAMVDGLAGLDEVDAEVWQLGFRRSDGETYIPQPISPDEYLASPSNMLVGGSMVRTDAFRRVGGFPDVALQDWALWRLLMRDGATFAFSDRPHFDYMRHSCSRGETELGLERRPEHVAEMMETERALA